MFHLGGLEEIPKTVSRYVKKSPDAASRSGVSVCSAQYDKSNSFSSHYDKTAPKTYVIPAPRYSEMHPNNIGWRGSNSLLQIDTIASVALPIELHPILFASLT